MAPRAFISGLSGLTLTADERAFLREARPWGLILFKRNIQDKTQVTDLVREALHELGGEAPVLVDQEGGRVQRLGPPLWPAYPPGAAYGRIYDRDPARGSRGGPARRAADRGRPHGTRHQRRLPAARRRAGRRRRPGDRRPRLWRDAGQGRGDRRGRRRGPGRRRRAAGAQAHPRPRPRQRRQPPKAAGGARRPCNARSHRLRRIPSPEKIAVGNDRPCGVHGDRPGATRRQLRPQ